MTAAPSLVEEAQSQTLVSLFDDGLFVDGDWVETKDQDPSGKVRLIQLADVGDGMFRDRSARFLTMMKAKELGCTFLEPGDVLVARMPEPLGRACIFPGVGQPAVTAVDVCILRPDPGRVKPEWLMNAINSPAFRAEMQAYVRGTTRQRISRRNLGNLLLCVPAPEVQNSVAELIHKIRSKQRSAALSVRTGETAVGRFRQAVLTAACSGGLTSSWRDNAGPSEPADLDAARRRRRSQPGRKFREPQPNPHSDLPDLPEGWLAVPLGLMLTEVKYGTSKRCAHRDDGAPVLRIPNVSSGVINLTDLKSTDLDTNEAESLRLALGDLLMIRSNGSVQLVGMAVPVTSEAVGMAYAGYLMRLRADPLLLDTAYLGMALASPLLRRQIEMPARSTSGVHNINSDEVRNLVLPLPPVQEQREIIRRVDAYLDLAASIVDKIQAASKQIERSSQAVLDKAFRGELLPPDSAA